MGKANAGIGFGNLLFLVSESIANFLYFPEDELLGP